MAHPAAQTPPLCVCKASASKPGVIASSVQTGVSTSVEFAEEMAPPARRCPALWFAPGKNIRWFKKYLKCLKPPTAFEYYFPAAV